MQDSAVGQPLGAASEDDSLTVIENLFHAVQSGGHRVARGDLLSTPPPPFAVVDASNSLTNAPSKPEADVLSVRALRHVAAGQPDLGLPPLQTGETEVAPQSAMRSMRSSQRLASVKHPGTSSQDDGDVDFTTSPGVSSYGQDQHGSRGDGAALEGNPTSETHASELPDIPGPVRESSLTHIKTKQEGTRMTNLEDSIRELLSIDGATGAAIVDLASGMALAQGGDPGFDLGIAAAGNSNVVRAKLATMRELGLGGKVDDILITLDEQYHLINVLSRSEAGGFFVYLVLDRAKANLALARYKLSNVSSDIEF